MIKLVTRTVRYDDNDHITSVAFKFKHIKKEDEHEEYPFLTAISIAFFKHTTFMEDEGASFKLTANPRRDDIADMVINLRKSKRTKQLADEDIDNLVARIKAVLNHTVS